MKSLGFIFFVFGLLIVNSESIACCGKNCCKNCPCCKNIEDGEYGGGEKDKKDEKKIGR